VEEPKGSRQRLRDQWPVLGRIVRRSTRYWRLWVAFVALGSLYSASRYVIAWLFKPLLDDVLVPSVQDATLEVPDVEAHLLEIGLVAVLVLIITPLTLFYRTYSSSLLISKVRRDVDQDMASAMLDAPLEAHQLTASARS